MLNTARPTKKRTKKQVLHLPYTHKESYDNSIINSHTNIYRFRSTAVSLLARWAQRNLSYCVQSFQTMSNLDDNTKNSPFENAKLSLVEAIEKLKQSFEIDIPNQHSVLYDELAKSGWYIDYNLAPKTLANLILLDYEKMSYLDQYLMDYFRKQSSPISKKIQRLYPNRKKSVNSAFKAHKRKEYELSILGFLAQIDGICYDLIEKDFLSISQKSEKNREQPKHWIIDQQFDNFKSSILEPLTKKTNTYLYK